MTTNGNEVTTEKHVSDIIGMDFIEWFGRIILIGCGTGRGKTYFALNVYVKWLLSQGKRVLYLCNRKKLEEQIDEDVIRYKLPEEKNYSRFTAISYQKFKERIEHGLVADYDVYICDEAHYFLADAGFNLYTDIPYFHILNKPGATVLFMTATYWNILERLKRDIDNSDELIEYYLPTDYSYVKHICWYKKQKDLYGIIDTILKKRPNDKILYFCNSNEKMKQLYEHYDPSHGKTENPDLLKESKLRFMSFICSDGTQNKWMKTHCFNEVEVTEIDPVTQEETKKKVLVPKAGLIRSEYGGYTFDSRMLITTKVVDNGIDFKDTAIKHIILDVFDIESALQCLGRKRCLTDEIEEEDTCNFYIRDWQSRQMNIFLQQVQDELTSPRLFIEDYEQWISKYGNDREKKDKTIYYDYNDREWKVNPLRYDKLVGDEALIIRMKNKEISYRTIVISKIGDIARERSMDIENIKAEVVKTDLDIWLELHVNKRLSKQEQAELINLCDIKDKFNRKQKSIKVVSAYIEQNFPYKLQSKVFKEEGKSVRNWQLTPRKKKSQDETAEPEESEPP